MRSYLVSIPWYRSGTCRLTAATIQCVKQSRQGYHRYDLVDHWFVDGTGPKHEDSAYVQFANIGKDVGRLHAFCTRFGPLHLAGFQQRNPPLGVPDCLDQVFKVVQTFQSLVLLCRAIREQQPAVIEQVPLTLWVPRHGRWGRVRRYARLPATRKSRLRPGGPPAIDRTIQRALDWFLTGTTMMMEWRADPEGWHTCWSVPSLVSGLALQLQMDLQGAGLHRQCPITDYGCGAVFVASRQSAKYCSDVCQKRAKVRRMRDRSG